MVKNRKRMEWLAKLYASAGLIIALSLLRRDEAH